MPTLLHHDIEKRMMIEGVRAAYHGESSAVVGSKPDTYANSHEREVIEYTNAHCPYG